MVESTLAKINIFSSFEQYNSNKGSIGANELSLIPSTDIIPIGFVIASASDKSPDGYLLCNGGTVSRSTYIDLFNHIGITYGAGDGSTTFNLPNLTDRFIQGSATVGTVKSAGLPAHTHNVSTTFRYGADVGGSTTPAWDKGDRSVSTVATVISEGASDSIYGASTTVQPPAVTMRFYIKY